MNYVNVLLIDDEKLAVEAMNCMVPWEEFGIHDIYKAYSMRQGQQICQGQEIDIIFCDIEMPRGSGLDFVEWLKETGKNPVVIFLTSHAVFSYAQQALKLGVQDYLLKPIDKEEMKKALTKALKTAENNKKSRRTGKRIKELEADGNQVEESVRVVKNYIAEHYSEPLTRESLASLVYLNADYLSRLFKKYTGLTLMDYVIWERMERAKQMLLESSLSVSEIALEVGYSNTAYFTKMFKKHTNGVTPREYRKGQEL